MMRQSDNRLHRATALAIVAVSLLGIGLAACEDSPPSDRRLLGSHFACAQAAVLTDEDGNKVRELVVDSQSLTEIEALELRAFLANVAIQAVNERHTYDPPYPTENYIRATWFIENCLRLPHLF